MLARKLSSLFGVIFFAVFCISAASGNVASRIALPGVTASGACPTQSQDGPLGY